MRNDLPEPEARVEPWQEEPRDATAFWVAGAGLVIAVALPLLRALVGA